MTPCQAYIFLFPPPGLPLPRLLISYFALHESFLITASAGAGSGGGGGGAESGRDCGAGGGTGRGAPASPSAVTPLPVLRLVGGRGVGRTGRAAPTAVNVVIWVWRDGPGARALEREYMEV